MARAEKIISVALGKEVKFSDGLLTLRDCYLSAEVNLRAVGSMKLAGEKVLMKASSMYAELVEQHRTVTDRVTELENQRALFELDYERCLRENEGLYA